MWTLSCGTLRRPITVSNREIQANDEAQNTIKRYKKAMFAGTMGVMPLFLTVPADITFFSFLFLYLILF